MFRLREKLKYMALGALIALVGFVFGSMKRIPRRNLDLRRLMN